MTPLFAEIEQANADSPDIFDYIVTCDIERTIASSPCELVSYV